MIAYLELLSALFILFLTLFIYLRFPQSRTERVYIIFGIICFISGILLFAVRVAFTLEMAKFINRFGASAFAFVFPTFLHFVLYFTKKDKVFNLKTTYFFLYFPPFLVSSLFLFTDIMHLRYEIAPYGIISQPSIFYWIFAVHSLIYSFIGIFLLIRFVFTTTQKTERMQAVLIALGAILGITLGFITDEFVPIVYKARIFPPTAVLDLALFNFFVFLAVRSFNLFTISPSIAASTILETMLDSLLVADIDSCVVLINREGEKLFKIEKEEIIGTDVACVFKDGKRFRQLWKEVVAEKKEIRNFEAELLTSFGETIRGLVNAKLLRNIFGGILGVVLIFRQK